MKLGVITDCFNKPLLDSIALAAELGLDGVQIYATTETFSPGHMIWKQTEEVRSLLEKNNLVVSALCGDLGGYGFRIPEENPERIEKTKRIIDLAEEFGSHVVTTHIGVIPSDKNNPTYGVMLAALTECGRYAQKHGVTMAIETGPEKATVLNGFVEDTDGGVGVNLDPANFVMVTDQNPAEAVYLLKNKIVHTHLKDGKMLIKTDPQIIYDCFAQGGIESLNIADYFIETPIGEGGVDFVAYLKALRDVGFDGFLTIERETGDDPAVDIRKACDFIRPLM